MSESVAGGHGVGDRSDRPTVDLMRRIHRAAPGTFGRIRVEIDLQVRIRKHHRTDIAPFHHDPAVCTECALTLDEHVTHRGQPRYRR